MLQRLILFLSFLFSLSTASAQATCGDSLFQFQQFIPGKFQYITADNLDNLYLVNETNQLKKLNAKGDSAGVFNEVRKYGRLYSMDVTNPLKILLYYRNFATIVVLDRFLNLRHTINLRNQNIFKVKAIGTSYDNNIWIFDEGDLKLKRIDDAGQVLAETVDFRMIFDEVPSPTQIIDQDGFVYLYDPERGFYCFDIYGAFKSKVPLLGWQFTEVVAGKYYGFTEKFLERYLPASRMDQRFPLPSCFRNAIQIKATNGKIYLMDKTGITTFLVN